MKPIDFLGATGRLGAPPGWDAERHGPCEPLPVHRTEDSFASVWKVSLRERLAILFGRPVMLWVTADFHPPVGLMVAKYAKEKR